jgi:hypothetical protein
MSQGRKKAGIKHKTHNKKQINVSNHWNQNEINLSVKNNQGRLFDSGLSQTCRSWTQAIRNHTEE